MVFLWFSYGFPVVFVAFTHQLEDFQPPRTRLVREDPEPEPAKPTTRLGFSHRGRRMAASKLLVGGLDHFEFSHILGSSSSQMTSIFFRGIETTNLDVRFGKESLFIDSVDSGIFSCFCMDGSFHFGLEEAIEIVWRRVIGIYVLCLADVSCFFQSSVGQGSWEPCSGSL